MPAMVMMDVVVVVGGCQVVGARLSSCANTDLEGILGTVYSFKTRYVYFVVHMQGR
jgi:hypothetical protein